MAQSAIYVALHHWHILTLAHWHISTLANWQIEAAVITLDNTK